MTHPFHRRYGPPHWLAALILLVILVHAAFGASDPKWQPPRVHFADSDAALAATMVSMAVQADPKVALTEREIYDNLVAFEGYRLKPYPDGPRGGFSVGIGHNLTSAGQSIKMAYTDAEVRQFFLHDLAVALGAARAGVDRWDELPKSVRIATLHLVWTCGPGGFMRWGGLRRALNRGALNTAASEIGDSRWYRQVSAARANYVYQSVYFPHSYLRAVK